MEQPKYWFLYYGLFPLFLTLSALRQWENLKFGNDNQLEVTAAICAISAGAAFTLTIIAEVIHTMVLLAPKVHAYIKSKGVAIGEAIGEARGEAKTKQAVRDWFDRKEAAEKANLPFNETPPWLT